MRRLSALRPEIERRIRAANKVLVFLDYDGTLVPIQPTPELARLSAERKKLLARLTRLSRFKAGLLTGRSLKDIRKAVGLSGLFYAANYGLAIVTPQKSWVHPGARQQVFALKKMLPSLKKLSLDFRGVRIEDKTLTAAIHYRQYRGKAGRLKTRLLEIIGARPHPFRLKTGKKVFEVYPAVKWDKGRALLKVEQMLGYRKKPLVIFIGDDEADEAAFRRMGARDIPVAVGRRKKTAARCFCKNSGEVARFLKLLWKAGANEKN
ncbi:MAG: trehalose-phosphatase [candidate division Zixibacteria bacterium]|nr:trehalose-phosphatase [candidate division Zixibacteria bacterium]MCI0595325.1 trehalose-phosphatase [candidate division Zixibacteria bacterium]